AIQRTLPSSSSIERPRVLEVAEPVVIGHVTEDEHAPAGWPLDTDERLARRQQVGCQLNICCEMSPNGPPCGRCWNQPACPGVSRCAVSGRPISAPTGPPFGATLTERGARSRMGSSPTASGGVEAEGARAMDSPEAVLVADLLKEINAAARLIELTEA